MRMARASAPSDLRFAQHTAGHLDVRPSPPGILTRHREIRNGATKSGGVRSPGRQVTAMGPAKAPALTFRELLVADIRPLGWPGPAQAFPTIQDILTKIE
jgi:hypothetical protein